MEKIVLKVFAKANLSLKINGLAPTGFHQLDMLVTSVGLFDKITVLKAGDCAVFMDGEVATQNNTAYRALMSCMEEFGIEGARIYIEKGIPFEAGLGGSSADAAGVLVALGKLYDLPYQELFKIACKIGSDVVFMMKGGTARAKGKGDDLEYFQLRQLNLVVAKPPMGVSTAQAFKLFDEVGCVNKADTQGLCRAFSEGGDVTGLFVNELQEVACKINPLIDGVVTKLKRHTKNVVMSGSGSAVLGIFENESSAAECARGMSDCEVVKVTKTIPYGIEILEEK